MVGMLFTNDMLLWWMRYLQFTGVVVLLGDLLSWWKWLWSMLWLCLGVVSFVVVFCKAELISQWMGCELKTSVHILSMVYLFVETSRVQCYLWLDVQRCRNWSGCNWIIDLMEVHEHKSTKANIQSCAIYDLWRIGSVVSNGMGGIVSLDSRRDRR